MNVLQIAKENDFVMGSPFKSNEKSARTITSEKSETENDLTSLVIGIARFYVFSGLLIIITLLLASPYMSIMILTIQSNVLTVLIATYGLLSLVFGKILVNFLNFQKNYPKLIPILFLILFLLSTSILTLNFYRSYSNTLTNPYDPLKYSSKFSNSSNWPNKQKNKVICIVSNSFILLITLLINSAFCVTFFKYHKSHKPNLLNE